MGSVQSIRPTTTAPADTRAAVVVSQHKPDALALEDDAAAVLEFLNERAGKRFPVRVPATGELSRSARLVLRLLRDGYTADDLRSVIAKKVREWGKRERMRPYLRPATLFGPENFEQYLGELDA